MKAPSTTEKRQQFEHLVERAERELTENPGGYRRRLLWMGLMGYAVIFGVLFLLVALIAGSIWAAFASTAFAILLLKKKLVIPLVLIAWVLIKALWVKLEPPDGYRLEREAFPRLFAEVDALRRSLAAPAVHRVVLTEEFNAGISQTPRLGVLGWHHNTLVLGLPLLLSLSPDQARAVLAHEFGHLSANHARFGGWIYRVRESWWRIMEAFDRAEHWAAGLMRRFFAWYAPWFSAYSFALARANEYEADAASVELTSPGAVGQALVGVHVHDALAGERFWSPLLGAADDSPDPVVDPYRRLHRYFRESPPTAEQYRGHASPLLEEETTHADTHPALRDRLEAVGAVAIDPPEVQASAAEVWFEDRLAGVLGDFDRLWLERNEEPWRERHEYVQSSREALDALRSRPVSELGPEERWKLAAWTEEFVPDEDALPRYLDYKDVCPDDPDADFVIGRMLLGRDDRSGLAHLKKALVQRNLVVDACNLAIGFLRSRGDERAAREWLLAGERHMDTENAARAERDQLTAKDTFVSPDLPEDWLDHLGEQLQAVPGLRHAWITRKQVEHFPESPVYVLVYDTAWLTSGKKVLDVLVNQLEVPGETFFLSRRGEHRKIARAARRQAVELF